jgi:hypothetical protein
MVMRLKLIPFFRLGNVSGARPKRGLLQNGFVVDYEGTVGIFDNVIYPQVSCHRQISYPFVQPPFLLHSAPVSTPSWVKRWSVIIYRKK